jgi:hypothetical protein
VNRVTTRTPLGLAQSPADLGHGRELIAFRISQGRRNVEIDFKRTQGNIIRFKIVEPGIISKVKSVIAKVPALISSEPPAPPPPPAKKKGGRPKKAG